MTNNNLMLEDHLLSIAEKVGENISNSYLTTGDYLPVNSWGCEGQIYPSLLGIATLELYKRTGKKVFLDGTKAIITFNANHQMKSGGWALSLGRNGNGIRFAIDSNIKKITADQEDLPPTVVALRLMSDYRIATEDRTFDIELNKGVDFLMKYWDDTENCFNEMLTGEALKLRANPKNYHIYAYQAIESLSKIYPELSRCIEPLYNSVKEHFEQMNQYTYPLLQAMHATLIIEKEKDSKFVKEIVKNRISNELGFRSPFLVKNLPGALGHNDGLRGVHLNEGHIRNSIGVSVAMKYYDFFIEKNTFTKTKFYSDLNKWIESMYNGDGNFYEFIDVETMKKEGLGTPGMYLPVFWILGIL